MEIRIIFASRDDTLFSICLASSFLLLFSEIWGHCAECYPIIAGLLRTIAHAGNYASAASGLIEGENVSRFLQFCLNPESEKTIERTVFCACRYMSFILHVEIRSIACGIIDRMVRERKRIVAINVAKNRSITRASPFSVADAQS